MLLDYNKTMLLDYNKELGELRYANVITRMDVVKTEHDLISFILELANERMSVEMPVNSNEIIARIDGIRMMASRLLSVLDDEEMQGTGKPTEEKDN